MYYPFFIAYMLVGFTVSLLVFLWALRKGQFTNQDRARFLPLGGEPDPRPVKVSKYDRIEILALAGLVSLGLLASAAFLIFSLIRVKL